MTVGWVAPHHDSFVRRAFRELSQRTPVQYVYYNYAIPGYTARRYARQFPGRFERIMQTTHPGVVVLAWGLENDIGSRKHRDTALQFGAALHTEIAQALNAHAVVVIVTPPVTKNLATTAWLQVQPYMSEEFSVGQSFHNRSVIEIPLYQLMDAYLLRHHQTYRPYEGNSWHPNRAGHILAGHLLANALLEHPQFSSSTPAPRTHAHAHARRTFGTSSSI